jgi:hypothetical protein
MKQFICGLQNTCNPSNLTSQKISNNTLDKIKKNIAQVQKRLNNLIEIKMPNISDKEILELSQQLDSLIYDYMIHKENSHF